MCRYLEQSTGPETNPFLKKIKSFINIAEYKYNGQI